jgi:ribosomal protein L23
MTIYEVIKRPLVTEKGVDKKGRTSARCASKWRRTPTRRR